MHPDSTPPPEIEGVRDNQEVADRVARVVAAELPPEYRGVYAGDVVDAAVAGSA